MQEPNKNTRTSAALSRLAVARSPSNGHNQPDTSLCSSRKSFENFDLYNVCDNFETCVVQQPLQERLLKDPALLEA